MLVSSDAEPDELDEPEEPELLDDCCELLEADPELLDDCCELLEVDPELLDDCCEVLDAEVDPEAGAAPLPWLGADWAAGDDWLPVAGVA